jgi:hypothetical protein
LEASFALKPVVGMNVFVEMGCKCSEIGRAVNAYKVLVGRSAGSRSLVRSRYFVPIFRSVTMIPVGVFCRQGKATSIIVGVSFVYFQVLSYQQFGMLQILQFLAALAPIDVL